MLFSRQPKRSFRCTAANSQLETLEVRAMLTVQLVDTALLVDGTEEADRIRIDANEEEQTLTVVFNREREVFDLNEIDTIIVNAGGGDDRVALSRRVNLDATLNDGEGNDFLISGNGNDELNGEAGNDNLRARDGDGDDVMRGGTGDDVLAGEAGEDRLVGQLGDDLLEGGDGDDKLYGGAGDNTLNGGDDTIVTGRGVDEVDGALVKIESMG